MRNYEHREEFMVYIENIDLNPSLGGVRLEHVPVVIGASIIGFIFGNPLVGIAIFCILAAYFIYVEKKEAEGMPITFNKTMIQNIHRLPKFIRQEILPSISNIERYHYEYRE